MRRIVALAAACAIVAPMAGARADVTVRRDVPPLEVVVPGTLLVRGPIEGARVVRELGDGRMVVAFDGDDAAATIARRDALLARGVDVELDLYRQGQAGPNDEGYPKQWALSSMKALDAWKVTTGDPELTVAVVDTGYVDHPDLLPRLVAGYDFITDPDNAGDGDGRDADPHDAGTQEESSSSFHGPHVSGIIGAATNNGIGMAGVDWNCRLQPVRVLGVKRHRGKDSDIADGIRWAAGLNVPGIPQNKTPARVINMSFGGPGFSRVLQDAVNAATARGVLVIASAGNNAEDASTNVPGALENVMSVAASGPDGKLASYSNFGPRVDLMAPGGALALEAPVGEDTPGAIWSTSFVRETNQPVFAFAAGTSQAAAYASGVAALVRAAAPALPPEVVAAVMRRASVMPEGGCEQGCGAGLIDASRAVAYAKQIEEAVCPEGCRASNELAPAKLRPEEGCRMGAGASDLPGYWIVLMALAVMRLRRQPLAFARGYVAAGLVLVLGCSSDPNDRESSSQSVAPPTVKIVDPIPTFENGELSISIGAGREVEARVTPDTALDRVELSIMEPPTVIGRVGHAPFRFFVPQWVLGEGGGRQLCIVAVDAYDRQSESCFLAVP